MDIRAQAPSFLSRRPGIVSPHENSSYVLVDSDGACIVAEPNTYTHIAELADAGRLEVRIGLFNGDDVVLLGDRGRPVYALRVRVFEAHAYPPSPLLPLKLGTFMGGALVQRELGFLEPIEGESNFPPPNQPGLGLVTPVEEAWAAAQHRYFVVGAPF